MDSLTPVNTVETQYLNHDEQNFYEWSQLEPQVTNNCSYIDSTSSLYSTSWQQSCFMFPSMSTTLPPMFTLSSTDDSGVLDHQSNLILQPTPSPVVSSPLATNQLQLPDSSDFHYLEPPAPPSHLLTSMSMMTSTSSAPATPTPSTCHQTESPIATSLPTIQTKVKLKRGRPPNIDKQMSDIKGHFECILCPFVNCSLNTFLKHIDTHASPEAPFPCQLCGKTFKYLLPWRNHICTHLSLKPFKCDQCKSCYVTRTELKRHKGYKHGAGMPYKCSQVQCNYVCVERAKLQRHQRMHAGLRPFKCSQCDYVSYDKSKIGRHSVTHTREKPFKCELCGSRFTQSGSLKTHLTNVHEMSKVEFRCPFCAQLKTSNMGELRNHIKTLHHSTTYPVIVNKPIASVKDEIDSFVNIIATTQPEHTC